MHAIRRFIPSFLPNMLTSLLILTLSVGVALVPGCAESSPDEHARATASDGSTSTTGSDATPSDPDSGELRLVVLSPALAVTLVDLGLEDRIVGRHAYDLVLRDSVPVCGDQGGIDYERLINAHPTHVLLEWGSRELPPQLLQLAGREGWVVSNHRLLTLDQVATTADDLHERFVRRDRGHESPAPEIPVVPVPGASGGIGATPNNPLPDAIRTEADQQRPSQRMARAWSERENRPMFNGRVLLLGSLDPLGVLGPGSAHHDMLVRLGATPAVTEGAPWITLDTEDLLALAPDAIVLVAPRSPDLDARELDPHRARTMAELRAAIDRLGLPATEDDRLAVIDHPFALLPSTALVPVANDLRAVLEGWGE